MCSFDTGLVKMDCNLEGYILLLLLLLLGRDRRSVCVPSGHFKFASIQSILGVVGPVILVSASSLCVPNSLEAFTFE